MQLVKWQNDSLSLDQFLSLPNHPRRAFENNGEMLTVSDSNVRSFASGSNTADVVIGTCEQEQSTGGYGGGYGGGGWYEGGNGSPKYGLGCTVSAPGQGARSGAFFALALAGLVIARRRRC